MNLADLQAELRHFVAERDWQPFHTPKNLSTALMVEAAELAEIFQWMTPEESAGIRLDQGTRARVGEEVADVLLYLLQVADQCQVDIGRAIKDKMARNALKHPVKRAIARVSPSQAAQPGTHVLVDYENVQPTHADLKAMVPGANKVWVFHGPHQRQVEQCFTPAGADVTAVPISKPGKNALDFHLAFYMGYIVSKNQTAEIVVVANDKGYGPMLEHAKEMGFSVRQQRYGQAKAGASAKTVPTATPAGKKPAAKKTVVTKAKARQPAPQQVPRKKPAAGAALVTGAAKKAPPAQNGSALMKMTESLRRMGEKRPVNSASLRRTLKALLGAETGDESIELALGKLIAGGVVRVGAMSDVSYPAFARTSPAG